MADVIQFPGVGIVPALGPRVDMDGVSERYTAYAEALETGSERAEFLAHQAAADIPALRDEIHRLEALRAELAAEVDRLTGGAV